MSYSEKVGAYCLYRIADTMMCEAAFTEYFSYPVVYEETLFVTPSEEFDFLVDWYERLAAVARSINQRQDDGRSGCSERKFAEVKDFFDKSQVQIDKLNSDRNKYSLYLSSRMKQILEMHNSGKWAKVEKIEAYRSCFL